MFSGLQSVARPRDPTKDVRSEEADWEIFALADVDSPPMVRPSNRSFVLLLLERITVDVSVPISQVLAPKGHKPYLMSRRIL